MDSGGYIGVLVTIVAFVSWSCSRESDDKAKRMTFGEVIAVLNLAIATMSWIWPQIK